MKTFIKWGGFPIVCFAISAIIMFLGDLVFDKSLHLAVFLWALSAIPFGVSLYRLRRSSRLAYGLFELVVAWGVGYATILGLAFRRSPTSDPWNRFVAVSFGMFAVIYFVVRALDNIGEGLNAKSKAGKRWDAVFPKAKRRGR